MNRGFFHLETGATCGSDCLTVPPTMSDSESPGKAIVTTRPVDSLSLKNEQDAVESISGIAEANKGSLSYLQHTHAEPTVTRRELWSYYRE